MPTIEELLEEEDRVAAIQRRVSAGLVNLDQHGEGGNATFTVMIGDRYYTVQNARPDFPVVNPDSVIDVVAMDRLVARFEALLQVSRAELTPKADAELYLLRALTDPALPQYTFGQWLPDWLSASKLDEVEPTNYSYYHALKAFTEAWQYLTALAAAK